MIDLPVAARGPADHPPPWLPACFNAKTGDIEDAPALDPITVFKVIERDGAVYIEGEESAIKSGRRKPNIKCSAQGGAEEKVIVVGGGSGALGAIEGLRNGGFSGPLTVISSEGHFPIDRTKLSKALMTDVEKLQWRDKSFYDSGSVQWVEDEVVDVDFSNRSVTTKSGGKHTYGKIVLATGGTPRLLPLQGFKVLENIFTLRTVHDAKKIVEAIGDKGKNIVIVGSVSPLCCLFRLSLGRCCSQTAWGGIADLLDVELHRYGGRQRHSQGQHRQDFPKLVLSLLRFCFWTFADTLVSCLKGQC